MSEKFNLVSFCSFYIINNTFVSLGISFHCVHRAQGSNNETFEQTCFQGDGRGDQFRMVVLTSLIKLIFFIIDMANYDQ